MRGSKRFAGLARTRPSEAPIPNADVDSLILGLARVQHGIAARWQLLAAGVTRSLLDHRVNRLRLRSVRRGIYAVPGLDGPRADIVAVVLGAGPQAAGSHGTAGHIQELVDTRPAHITLSTACGHQARRSGIVHHRVLLQSDERTICDGVPVTAPARTILDLAASLPNRQLEQVVARGIRLHGITSEQILTLVARYPRRPGTPRLQAMLSADALPSMTRSEAEERFRDLARTSGLPAPQVNVRLHGYEVDFYWRAHDVVVEIDGLAYHSTRDAQLRDRQRDTTLAAAGIRVLRFTWHDLTKLPHATLVKVALALGAGRAGRH